MPTYEYECRRCGNVFEEFQSITDAPRQRCPKCRGKVHRLISSGVGIVFKGSGFYVTDSRKGKVSPPASTGGGVAKKDSTDGGEKKSEAKKTEAKKTKKNGSAAA